MKFNRRSSILIYVLTLVIIFGLFSFFMTGPFVWLLSTSFKHGEDIFLTPPNLIPVNPTLGNYSHVWNGSDIPLYFFNSVIVAILSVVMNLVFSALTAYPLAHMNFKGRKWVFLAILATMVIPFPSIMLPIFLMCQTFGLANTFLAVALPTGITAIGVYLLRQAFLVIPVELQEAARIDGCSEFKIWYRIMLPLIKPSLATLAIITFTASWSDFLWPLIILQDPEKFTMPVGMQYFMSMLTSNWQYISAVSVIAIIPTIVLFLLLQRYFYAGSLSGSVKG